MNSNVKKKWIAALRSDEYKQGRGHLRYANEYCCLGVLCDLFVQDGTEEGHWQSSFGGLGKFFVSAEYSYAVPPHQVCEWAGLDEKDMGILANLNDGQTFTRSGGEIVREPALSFRRIATFIETFL